MEKNQERDENMAKMMTQMDLLTKHVMSGGYKVVNAVGANSGMSSNDAQFLAMYNKKVQFLTNQARGSRPRYPRPSGNQGWTEIVMMVGEIKIDIGVIGVRIGKIEMVIKIVMWPLMNVKSQINQRLTPKAFGPRICFPHPKQGGRNG
ncbi:hypothetical protein MTR67_023286 [Solanum verrucosum]|uniref:Uncharacterized protein n=1 Tax=Solanum verrucosum TaxID=315347 RepID=A0AAF0TRP5_SOLVR|nr:hypothetical protein MTR67_023286 [Solanum verrucosum]